MSILDRVVLAIYMLLVLAVSLCIAAIPFNIIPQSSITGIVDLLYNNWYYSLIPGLLLALVSIKLMFTGVSVGKRHKSGIIKTGEFGDIRISVETFESLAMRGVKQVPGIKDAKVRIYVDKGELTVFTTLQVLSDINIPNIAGEVQNKIKSQIESTTDVGVKEVKVSVENIASVSSARVE